MYVRLLLGRESFVVVLLSVHSDIAVSYTCTNKNALFILVERMLMLYFS